MLFVALGVTKAATAGQDADWYFNSYQAADPWGPTGAGQFKTTEDANIFLLKGLYITEKGVNFCVRNGDWTVNYGWKNAGVTSTGTPVELESGKTGSTGWLDLPEGVYDVTWNTENSTIQFDASNITITIGAYGWATFGSSYALDFTGISGLEAYLVIGREGNAVTTTRVEGTVPAATGLLLKGAAGNYIVPIVANSSTDVSSNLMKAGAGTAISAVEGKTRYVLGVNAGKAEFQKITETAATVPAGKAYLQFDEVISGARALIFDPDEVTSINVVEVTEPEAGALKDGKFLENGKIVIVKNGVKYSANGQILK